MPIEFNPADPFPLFEADSYSLKDAQEHAARVDSWLGLEPEKIERETINRRLPLCGGRETQAWIGLPVRSMLTPYVEIRSILSDLNPRAGSTIIDLGAGYGRMAWVIARHYPEVRFIGYELIQERIDEYTRCLGRASEHRLAPAMTSVLQTDLASPDFSPAPAEYYFIYDFGTREAIEKVLRNLRGIASSRAITVVGRGRSSRDAIERSHPWLSQILPPRHTRNYSIYRSG